MIALKEADSGVATGKTSVIKTYADEEDKTETEIVCCEPQREHTKGFKVCAICCKEKALADVNGISEAEQEIDEKKDIMEKKLGRPLKLRESKAIERKVIVGREREKQRAKEERRRLREEGGKGTKEDTNNHTDAKDHEMEVDDNDNEAEDASDGSVGNDIEPDEEEDPFLKAIGGRENMLTGEAYQKQLLEKEQK